VLVLRGFLFDAMNRSYNQPASAQNSSNSWSS